MRRIVVIMLCALAAAGWSVPAMAASTSVDSLIEKLVEKNVLSKEEARELKEEIKADEKLIQEDGYKTSLPSFIRTMKMKGDFRLRYQYNHSKTVADQTNERHRGRFRLRFGIDSKVNDKLEVGLGLATGTADQTGFSANKDITRSTNQSLDSTFSKHPVNLDYAYAKYMPVKWATILGGKMLLKDTMWEPGDLIWDTDITPEGGAVYLTNKLLNNAEWFAYNGFFVIEEDSSSGDDPWMAYVQPGIKVAVTDELSAQAAVGLYYWGVGNTSLNNSAGSNSFSASSRANPKKDFINVVPAVELGIKDPFNVLGLDLPFIPYAGLFGEYVINLSEQKPKDNRSGFMLGASIGHKKVQKWAQWQLKYNFARLEKDAVLDVLPDSDRYEGQTGIRAHEGIFEFGLGDNTWMSVDFYRAQKLAKPYAPESVLQVDWNLRF